MTASPSPPSQLSDSTGDRRSAGLRFGEGLRWLLLALVLLTAARWFYAANFELAPDEAYYFQWTQHPALSYYSKGPVIAWAIGLGTALFGDNELGVRLLSPLLSAGTMLLVYFFVARTAGVWPALWTVLALHAAPIFTAGSFLMTIDPLSIFFWMAAIATLWRARNLEPGKGRLWWLITGLLIGLGFLAKWTNAFQLASLVALFAFSPNARRHLRTAGPWLLLAGFLICTWPPVAWNAQNDWITLTHLKERGNLDAESAAQTGFNPLEFFVFFGMHFGVYSPVIFAVLAASLFFCIRSALRGDRLAFFIACLALPNILTYAFLSLKQAGEPNWTAPGFFSLGLWAGPAAYRWARESASHWPRIILAGGIALGMGMSLALLQTDLFRVMGIPWPYQERPGAVGDPTARLRGWRTLSTEIERLRVEEAGPDSFLVASKYQLAAAFGFYLPEQPPRPVGHPPVYLIDRGVIQNQFSFWPNYLDAPGRWTGKNALYITDQEIENPPSIFTARFDSVELISILEASRRGYPVRRLRVFLCTNFQPGEGLSPAAGTENPIDN